MMVTRFVSKNVKGMEITATNLLDLRKFIKKIRDIFS